jgi:hypothetical protein
MESPPVERELPVVIRPLLSSKMRPHFKTYESLGKKNRVMGLDRTSNQN